MKTAKRVAPLLPYAATWIGIHLLASAWAAVGLYHAGMVALLLATRWRVSEWRVRGAVAAGAVTVVACAAAGLLIYLLWDIARLDTIDLGTSLKAVGLDGASWWLFAAHFVVVHPALEEAFWRGMLGSTSKRVVANDLIFGGYHAIVLVVFLKIPFVVLSCVLIAAAAWVWRRMMTAGGAGWAVAAHAAADAAVVVAASALGAGGAV